MDQYANMNGKKDHVILLDCRSIEHQYFPLEIKGYKVVLSKHAKWSASKLYRDSKKENDLKEI